MAFFDRDLTSDSFAPLQTDDSSYSISAISAISSVSAGDASRVGWAGGYQNLADQSTDGVLKLVPSVEQLKAWIASPIQSPHRLLVLMNRLSLVVVADLTMVELNQLAAAIKKLIVVKVSNITPRQRCRQWYARTTQEIRQRQVRYWAVQRDLQQNLRAIQELNAHSYEREFSHLNLDALLQRVLDGEEEQLQRELSECCAAVSRFYETHKRVRLARIKARVQEAKWNLKRTRIACRLFPLLGLIVSGFFLHLSINWRETIAVTGLGVAPLMVWVSYSMGRGVKGRALQELERRNGLLLEEWDRLNGQEVEVRNRCAVLLNADSTGCSVSPC